MAGSAALPMASAIAEQFASSLIINVISTASDTVGVRSVKDGPTKVGKSMAYGGGRAQYLLSRYP